MLTVRNVNVKGKTVLLRADFNVSIKKNGTVADDFRIRMTIPTIEYLQKQRARIVIVSHLGRPKGKDRKLSLRPVAEHLGKLLDERVFFFDAAPKKLEKTVRLLPPEAVVMLENIRFLPGEEKNAPQFARDLARLGDVFVNDAFAVSHRNTASVVGVTRYLKSYIGLLLERELDALDRVRRAKKRPFGVIIGGAKIEDKFPAVEEFLKKADWVFVGGGVANTFLWAEGIEVGKSIKEKSYLAKARSLLKSKKLILPVDWRVSTNTASRSARYCYLKNIGKNELILDIGPKSIAMVNEKIRQSKMVLWAGPVGYFENPRFMAGSRDIARAIASNRKAFSFAGGGDTIDLIRNLGLEKKYSFISTGGSAMLEYLAGKKLIGIEALY